MSNNLLFLCFSLLIGVSLGDQQLFEQNEKDGVPENGQHPPLAPISGLLPLPDSGKDPFGLFLGPREKDGNLEREQSGGRKAQQTTEIDDNDNVAGQKPQPDVVVSDPFAILSKSNLDSTKSKGIEGQYENVPKSDNSPQSQSKASLGLFSSSSGVFQEHARQDVTSDSNAHFLHDKKDPSGLFSDSSFGSNLKGSEHQKDPESNVAAIPQPQSDASNLFLGAPEKSLSNIFKSTGASLSGNADIFSKDRDLNEENNSIQTNQVSQGAERNMKTNQQILNDRLKSKELPPVAGNEKIGTEAQNEKNNKDAELTQKIQSNTGSQEAHGVFDSIFSVPDTQGSNPEQQKHSDPTSALNNPLIKPVVTLQSGSQSASAVLPSNGQIVFPSLSQHELQPTEHANGENPGIQSNGNGGPFKAQPVSNGEGNDGLIKDQPVSNGEVNDGLVKDQPVSNGEVNDGLVKDQPVSNGEVNDGLVKDQPVSNGEVNDGLVKDQPVSNGEVNDGPFKAQPVSNGEVNEGLFKAQPVSNGEVNDGLVKAQPVSNGEVNDGLVKDQPVSNGEVNDNNHQPDPQILNLPPKLPGSNTADALGQTIDANKILSPPNSEKTRPIDNSDGGNTEMRPDGAIFKPPTLSNGDAKDHQPDPEILNLQSKLPGSDTADALGHIEPQPAQSKPFDANIFSQPNSENLHPLNNNPDGVGPDEGMVRPQTQLNADEKDHQPDPQILDLQSKLPGSNVADALGLINSQNIESKPFDVNKILSPPNAVKSQSGGINTRIESDPELFKSPTLSNGEGDKDEQQHYAHTLGLQSKAAGSNAADALEQTDPQNHGLSQSSVNKGLSPLNAPHTDPQTPYVGSNSLFKTKEEVGPVVGTDTQSEIATDARQQLNSGDATSVGDKQRQQGLLSGDFSDDIKSLFASNEQIKESQSNDLRNNAQSIWDKMNHVNQETPGTIKNEKSEGLFSTSQHDVKDVGDGLNVNNGKDEEDDVDEEEDDESDENYVGGDGKDDGDLFDDNAADVNQNDDEKYISNPSNNDNSITDEQDEDDNGYDEDDDDDDVVYDEDDDDDHDVGYNEDDDDGDYNENHDDDENYDGNNYDDDDDGSDDYDGDFNPGELNGVGASNDDGSVVVNDRNHNTVGPGVDEDDVVNNDFDEDGDDDDEDEEDRDYEVSSDEESTTPGYFESYSKDGDVDNNNAHGEVKEEGKEDEEDDWYHNPDTEAFDDEKNRFQVDDFDDYASADADGLFGVDDDGDDDDDDAHALDRDFDADADDLWSKYESRNKDKHVIGDELFREGQNENDLYSRGRFPAEELMNQLGDEVEETKPPTAPTNMVLIYTWMILAILVMVIVVSTYQAKCKWILSKGGRQQTRGGGGVGGEDRKRLLDNEFV